MGKEVLELVCSPKNVLVVLVKSVEEVGMEGGEGEGEGIGEGEGNGEGGG